MSKCCCCCCPPAVSALLCLWVGSGFSKSTVAGALTFFPPTPSMYKFERIGKDGETLPDEEEDDEEKSNGEDIANSENDDGKVASSADALESLVSADGESKNGEVEMKKIKSKNTSKSDNIKSQRAKVPQEPVAEEPEVMTASTLSDRQRTLVKKSRKVYNNNKADAKNSVTYRFVLDPSLRQPRSRSIEIERSATKLHDPKSRSYIAVLSYRILDADNASLPQNRKTLLYSHGNATDLGAMNFMCHYLCRGLGVNVVIYDYSGYGASGGVPREENTYSNIMTVFNYIYNEPTLGNQDSSSILVYGQSVGSGPSCYVSSNSATRDKVGGLILHSPFMSGMRVLTPSRALACLDIFPNITRITKVRCPTMIIHGMKDKEVDVSHGFALHNAVPEECKRDPWFVQNAGHNDICDSQQRMEEYIRRLKRFIDGME